MRKVVNVIDLFAGPGGLGEGFSSFFSDSLEFKIRMSIEREASAHRTLTLRAFFRLLKSEGNEQSYFDYVEGRITKAEMILRHTKLWDEANKETFNSPTALGEDNERIRVGLNELKKKYNDSSWIVIGGPPCQAYSLVGRARNKGNKSYSAENDQRHFLYQEYLNVLSIMQPDVFVMENVKGILSSKVDGEYIFPKILEDLQSPDIAVNRSDAGRKYRILSFTKYPECETDSGLSYNDNRDFIIRAEDFGVPQNRHRVILLGIATDIDWEHQILSQKPQVQLKDILTGLPPLRSKLSKEIDGPEAWRDVIASYVKRIAKDIGDSVQYQPVLNEMQIAVKKLQDQAPISSTTYPQAVDKSFLPHELRKWLFSKKPTQVLNHHSRAHMSGDLARYLFSACWAKSSVYGETNKPFPKSEDYPDILAPAHANWKTGKFADRFRVQQLNRPATTVTSHISKDGHYFIHPDPTQCRSLTVREAARIQTFPDNYFFEGNRTEQYVQVGNAVPPYLAFQLAEIVSKIF